jgi:hypothetical protein
MVKIVQPVTTLTLNMLTGEVSVPAECKSKTILFDINRIVDATKINRKKGP